MKPGEDEYVLDFDPYLAQADARRWRWCVQHPYEAMLILMEATNRDSFQLDHQPTIEQTRSYFVQGVDEWPQRESSTGFIGAEDMKAADFYSEHLVMYPKQVNRISYSSIKVLEFLNGRPWDDIALAYVHALRPYAIRVTKGMETCDSVPYRVTVYVDSENRITGMRQEVEVWLPDGVENGHHLGELIRHAHDE